MLKSHILDLTPATHAVRKYNPRCHSLPFVKLVSDISGLKTQLQENSWRQLAISDKANKTLKTHFDFLVCSLTFVFYSTAEAGSVLFRPQGSRPLPLEHPLL